MLENLRLLKLDPRDYIQDFFWIFVLGLVANQIYIAYPNLKDVNFFPFNLEWIPLLVLFMFYILFWKPMIRWLVYQTQRLRSVLFENRFSFDSSRFTTEWEFQGNVSVDSNRIQVTNTPSGCLIKNDFWDSKV